MNKHAFSLVELSIVLVILGLLTGGILAGQSLIRASELRSVITEQQRFTTATQSFRDKYMALPGDMTNATAFWGKDNTNCAAHTGTAATPGTCNGNGNGGIDWVTIETFRFWQQLALAGLIEGSYTGLAGGGSASHHILGTNAPRAKLSNAGWGVWHIPNYAGDGTAFELDYTNTLEIGANIANAAPQAAIFRPEEAWGIDTKLDDGRPASGKVIGRYWNNLCSAADDGSHADNDYAASYRLTDTTPQCTIIFRQGF